MLAWHLDAPRFAVDRRDAICLRGSATVVLDLNFNMEGRSSRQSDRNLILLSLLFHAVLKRLSRLGKCGGWARIDALPQCQWLGFGIRVIERIA